MLEPAIITANGRELTLHGTVELYLQWHRGWNADISAIYATSRDVPAGSTVIDVGANIGVMSCSLAAQRPDLNIIAIEPVPPNFECLRRNVEANGLTNVEVVHAAVSDKPGEVRVNINGPWSAVLEKGEVAVPAVTLDQFIDRKPAYIKIDVEGWEPYVLAGGRSLFAAHQPLVFMEWNTWSLSVAHHDPISFCRAVWCCFDVLELYHAEVASGPPSSDIDIVSRNITQHGSVTDVLMRPKQAAVIPQIEEMIYSPAHVLLRRKDALRERGPVAPPGYQAASHPPR